MFHSKQSEVELLINNKIPVLLEGQSGSGKTTILITAAKNADIPYSFISGTRQTTVSHIIGFMNVNGVYSPSPFRTAYVEGHYFNIDEIDAMDSNVLLIFNSLENNIMAFPDGYTDPPHENFRLMATANPQNQHDSYVGRNKLDAATLDRFDQVSVDRDSDLEKSLIDSDTFREMGILRSVLEDLNSSKILSMRDSMRYQKRKNLGITEGFIEKLVGHSDLIIDKFREACDGGHETHTEDISNCKTFDELVNLVTKKKIQGEAQ